MQSLGEELPDEDKALLGHYFGDLQYDVVRDMMLKDKKRLDGRETEDVRQLAMETDIVTNSTWFCFIYKR